MQRFPAASYGGGVNSSAVGGTSARDTARPDSSFSSSNFALSSRRSSQLTPYKLKCDKDPLNCRLGPADFYPQTPNCPEETLTRDYLQAGYKEIVEGIEDSRETSLTYVGPLTKPIIFQCKEAIRKRLRAINESRAQKRKAGQVYGVPLSGPLLNKPGVFPEQRPCGEDFRKKWIECLSQQHKRLQSLADHVPHGFRKKHLFEVLIRHNVPLLRATWFIKVSYLNQVRPTSAIVASGAPDRTQLARTELWTKDVIEYLQYLLDEFLSISIPYGKDQSPQVPLAGSVQHRGDSVPAIADGEEPILQFKWWYMVRILQWHQAERLLFSSLIIEWVLNQLQVKESVDALQLLLPIVFDVIDTIALSQTYVRMLVDIAVRSIQNLSQGVLDVANNSQRPYVTAALVEMLRYLILAVPDTFVALDCFPLPPVVAPDVINSRHFRLTDAEKSQHGPVEFANICNGKSTYACHRYLSFGYVVSSVQRRTGNLALAVNPGSQGHGVAKVVQALDRVLIQGDVRGSYSCLFDNLFDGGVEEGWIAEVSPCLRSSLKWISAVSPSVICSVFLLCEWATCDFRNCRTALPHHIKLTGRKDFCPVYAAVLLLKLRKEDMYKSVQSQLVNSSAGNPLSSGSSFHDVGSAGTAIDNLFDLKNGSNSSDESEDGSDIVKSTGPLHDVVVCWLDQHEASRGEGFKCLQMLIMELIRFGIFYPPAYVRQLIVSGIMDKSESQVDLDRQKRHYRILKQLPGSYLLDVLDEAKIVPRSYLFEVTRIYSNERRLLLNCFLRGHPSHLKTENGGSISLAPQKLKDNSTSGREDVSRILLDRRKRSLDVCNSLPVKCDKTKGKVEELKAAISVLLHLPSICSASLDRQQDESQGHLKRIFGSLGTKNDFNEGTPGCEECKRANKQKVSDERNSFFQGVPPSQSDDEDNWWVRKGSKPLEPFKVDPPLKPTKTAARGGRQKVVRKTTSLAQLAAARIEGSQGASTSHVCDNKITCPHHKTGMDGEISRSVDVARATHLNDIGKIGKSLKQLRLLEKRSITLWLIASIRQLVEGSEKPNAKVADCTGTFSSSIDERSAIRWKLGEDELSSILYFFDVSSDLFSAVKLLLWLLPKAFPGPSSSFHVGRNILASVKNTESNVCEVGEAFLLSSIRRYENIIIATDLIPEVLSAAMLRSLAVMTTNGRASGSPVFVYARNLLKKFGSIPSVVKWEKNFKLTCDQRLLAELETVRPLDSELGFSLVGVAAGMVDVDDYFRQKITGRISRAGSTMKEIVHRLVEEALHNLYGKERKLFTTSAPKGTSGTEKWDNVYQIAQQIVSNLVDFVRQSGAAAQEWDPSFVASAVSAIVGSLGSVILKLPDFSAGSNYSNFSSTGSSLSCAQHIIRIHITSLCMLKEALGERQSRVFEVALATEASSSVSGAFASGKISRNQFQLSPETHDASANLSNEILNSPAKLYLGRPAKAVAAVSALVIGAVVHGVASLDRMVTVFRIKEGLDVLQFIRGAVSTSNGVSRSVGASKVDSGIEVCLHWFRLLAGNCRTVCDGLVMELLGETYALALSRMQRMLPLSLVLPPAYSIFGMVIWRPYILHSNVSNREDIQLYQSLSSSVIDTIRHQPFRDVCFQDTNAFYGLLASDVSDSEFAAMLELHSPDKHLKTMAFIPLRARLFLNAILDCRLPQCALMQDDGAWVPGQVDTKVYADNEKPLDQLVHVLDTLQLAKFHWQWIELRLLLNEQVLTEKVETHNMSLVEALRFLSTNTDNALSENERSFIEIVLTRLLVRPDAAALYSELLCLLGRSFEEELLLHAKWFLAGSDVLLGRKSIRQRLANVAQLRGLSTKVQFWKPWGWSSSVSDMTAKRGEKRKLEVVSLEEGEVVEDGIDIKMFARPVSQKFDSDGRGSSKLYVTEKALAELVLPCIDQSSNDSRTTFANELIKQMNIIEQQISNLTRGVTKQVGAASGVEGTGNKNSTRKGTRGVSPGLGRRSADSFPPSAAALRASMWLRLQFILRLFPIVYADREPLSRNMRHMLAAVILRLLGTRVVHEDADHSFFPVLKNSLCKREVEPLLDASVFAQLDLSGDSLFDWCLCVLHGLLSSYKPSWVKPKPTSKSTVKSPRDFSAFDREVAESLQADLDRMQLPATIRRRIQAAMPVLPPSLPFSTSCQLPMVSAAALCSLQSSLSTPALQPGNFNLPQRSSSSSIRASPNFPGKGKPLPSQDPEIEIDPWTLMDDATGSGPVSSSSNVGVGSDQGNLKACSWLKGAVRVRRTDLTYIGPMDDDS